MIYLIGGAPRIGKSIIGKKFAKSIKGHFISTDKLEENIKKPPEAVMLYFSGNENKNTLTSAERVEILLKEAETLYNNLQALIEENVNKDHDVVIEGVHLLPKYVAVFIKKFGGKNIKSIFIGSTNTKLILKGLIQNTGPNNWHKKFSKNALQQIAGFSEIYSKYIKNETQKYNFSYIERSDNFQKDIINIINKLIENKNKF